MFNQYEPQVEATIAFLKLLKVKVNNTTVNETLQNHPDWPSLLCISDSLNKWHVPNAAGRIDKNDIEQLPMPLIAHTHNREVPLSIVTEVTDTEIFFYQSNYTRLKKETKEEFLAKWHGIYLIAEPNEHSGEVGYRKKRKQSFFKQLVPAIAGIVLLSISFLLLEKIVVAAKTATSFFPASIYLQYIISLAGIIITSLLLWYEIDKNNPALKKICTGIAKANCNAILTSKQAKIFSWLSWSEAGFFYFTGGLLTLLFAEDPAFNIPVIGWLNILAAPYIIFSLYYQWRTAKQWCPLCLIVQFLLFTGAVNSIAGNFLHTIPVRSVPANLFIVLYYLTPVLIWYSAKPYILRLQKEKTTRREYLRIKFNAEIFNTLLKKQNQLTHSADGLGITLGNPAATNELVKVCNPYCGPCSKAHPEIEKLLEENSNLKIRIIFTATTNEEDKIALPVKHLLAIADKNNEALTKKALDDWYLADKKDYDAFAAKYPMSGEIKQQNSKVKAMDNWCKAMEIMFTPTLFIKGFKLPDAYSIEDLTYFLLE